MGGWRGVMGAGAGLGVPGTVPGAECPVSAVLGAAPVPGAMPGAVLVADGVPVPGTMPSAVPVPDAMPGAMPGAVPVPDAAQSRCPAQCAVQFRYQMQCPMQSRYPLQSRLPVQCPVQSRCPLRGPVPPPGGAAALSRSIERPLAPPTTRLLPERLGQGAWSRERPAAGGRGGASSSSERFVPLRHLSGISGAGSGRSGGVRALSQAAAGLGGRSGLEPSGGGWGRSRGGTGPGPGEREGRGGSQTQGLARGLAVSAAPQREASRGPC